MASDDWGFLPSDSELAAPDNLLPTELCRLLTRTLHLTSAACSEKAQPLCSALTHARDSSDEWVRLIAASLEQYQETGCVSKDTEEHRRLVERLSASLATSSKGTASRGSGYTLLRAQTLSTDGHFQTRPSALRALEQAFRPADLADAGTHPPQPTAATASSSANAPSSAKAAPPPAAAPTSSVLLNSRAAGGWRVSGGTMGRDAARARAGLGLAKQKPKMMAMDIEEASKLHAAALKPAKEKKAPAAKPKPKAVTDPFQGAVVDAPNGLVHYWQDRRKKWTYTTGELGGSLLRGMIDLTTPLLRSRLEALPDNVTAEGVRIYAQKPNLGANGVTWSQDDYGHLGLQAEYLRLKSLQRFTEGWMAMQRAYNAGALRKYMGEGPAVPLRVASFGGGPGFELVAIRSFCERHLPRASLSLASLDLATEWKPCAEGLGVAFHPWNVNDGDGVLKAAGWEGIDLAVISCALPRPNHHRLRSPTATATRSHACAHTHALTRMRSRAHTLTRIRSRAYAHAHTLTRMRSHACAHTHALAFDLATHERVAVRAGMCCTTTCPPSTALSGSRAD